MQKDTTMLEGETPVIVDGGSAGDTTPAPSNDDNKGTPDAGTTPAATDDKGGEPQLYKLPDGREVDGATLADVYKSLLGDYTTKAQTLSQLEKAGVVVNPNKNINAPQNPWEDPSWVPGSYAEIVAASKAAFKAEQLAEQSRIDAARQQTQQQIDSELAEIRKIEPNVSEDLLFAHATKYGFQNLQQAFANMRDLNVAIKTTQKQTQANLQNRAKETINTKGGEVSKTGEGVDFSRVSDPRGNAIDYLRSLQGK